MADRIKGITVVLGGDTTGLSKALSGVNKEISSTQKQLKDVEKLLKLDPGNTELLAQKQRLLNDAVDQTKTKLTALQNAEKQVQQQFERGEVSQEQYDGLKREIIATEAELKKAEKAAYDMQEQLMQSASEKALQEMEQAAADLDRQLAKVDGKDLKDVSDSAKTAASSIDKIDEKPVEDVADAADDAKSSLSDAGKEAADFGDILSAGTIIEGAKSISGAISDISEETLEYRKIMGTLEASSEKAGYSADATSEAYYQLYWALGDDQTAATALANLQALNLEQGDLMNMIDLVTGAWATYGDSIPIDGLAESVNETIRTGTVTGTFADVLNWGAKEGETFGVMLKENTEANQEWNDAVNDAVTAEDYFNLALQDASSQQERANLVAQAMASQGLAETADAWYQNNKDIVNANDAQLNFMENASAFSETVSPAVNAVKEGGNELFSTFVQLAQGIDFNAIAGKINQIFSAVQQIVNFVVSNQGVLIGAIQAIGAALIAVKIQSFVSSLMSVVTGVSTASAAFPALAGAISLLTNPVFLVTAAVVALGAIIASNSEAIIAALQSVDSFLQSVFAVDFTSVFGPVLGSALNAFMANLQNLWNGIYTILGGIITFVTGVFSGNWKQAWEGIKQIFKGVFESLVAIAKAPINAIIGLINGVIGGINMMIDGLNSISIDVPDGVPVLGGKHIGFNIGQLSSIPYLAKGGTVVSGSAIVGEAGPELLTVGSGETVVQPLTSSGGISPAVSAVTNQQILSAAQMIVSAIENSQIIIGDEQIGRANARYVADRAIITGGVF